MKHAWNIAQVGLSAVGGWLGWLLGGFDGFLFVLVAFTVLDYVTGVTRGIIEKNLSSEVGFHGILRKVLIFVMVAVGNMIDQHIIGSGAVVRSAVIFFYASNEGISILENVSAVGLPIPEKVREILTQIRNGGGKK